MSMTDHWTPSPRVLRRIVTVHRTVYRRTGGRVMARARRKPVVLLTTTGRRTGRLHTTPLPFYPDGDRLVVIASNSGSDRHPAWYLNLCANPEVEVQVGPRASRAAAATLTGDDRQRVWARLDREAPWYSDYQAHTAREIPLVAITPDHDVRHDAPPCVERPAAGWWVAVLGGMTVLGLIAFRSSWWRWWSTRVTSAVPRGAYRALFWAAVATHVAEGTAAVRLAERAGEHAATLSWGAQTTLLGFPSLRLLRRRAGNDTTGDEFPETAVTREGATR